MIAGLPGVGLGGLYYVCLTLLMPLRFLLGEVRARQPRQRRIMLRVVPLALIILIVLGLEAWALHALASTLAPAGTDGTSTTSLGLYGLAPRLALLPFVLLAVVVGGLHLMRLFLPARRGID